MKRVQSRTLFGRVKNFGLQHWRSALISFGWIVSILFVRSLTPATNNEPISYTQVCATRKTIDKGETLNKEDLYSITLPIESIPKNTISDCNQPELLQVPLAHQIQADDILQQSTFMQPITDESRVQSALLEKAYILLYLSPKDLHQYPLRIENGQFVAFYAKTKADAQSFVLAPSVKVVDVLSTKDSEGNQQISQFGIQVTSEQALQFTKVFEQKGVIQMALTAENAIASPSTTLKNR